MKILSATGFLTASLVVSAYAGGLYHVPNEEAEDTLPIKWSVGMSAVWDDNTTPTDPGPDDQTFSLNPYTAMEFSSAAPQTTWDVMAKLGLLYYFDEPVAAGSDDSYGQMRAGFNLTHRFDERLRFVTRNFISYELEPDYSYGVATNRQSSEYVYWDVDNALGYRWTERLATYTGIKLTMLDYSETANSDRFTSTLYNQFRYVLSPQTVGTATIRYAQTTGAEQSSDSTDTYLLIGAEHRFSPSTILIGSAGAQFRQVDAVNGKDSTSPYLELTLRSQVNQQLIVSGFARYGAEVYDTVVNLPLLAEYDSRLTLRLGTQATYEISEKLSLFSGIDLISASFENGRAVVGGAPQPDQSETLFNAYLGTSLKLTEYLAASLTYNFTTADSDLQNRSYDRNRISVGLQAEF
jgi:hypothetical protein